jgi:putative membrane protein
VKRVAALLAFISVGCASQGTEAALADTSGRRDSIAAVAAASMREEHVYGLIDHIHASDSAMGVLGAVQGSTLALKDFGRMVTREHMALHRDAERLAAELGIAAVPPPVAPDAPPPILRQRLDSGSPSAGWDRAYLEYAIAVHESAMENTARSLAATNRQETRQYLVKSIPILQKHLDKAQVMRKAIARTSGSGAAAASKTAPAGKAPDTSKSARASKSTRGSKAGASTTRDTSRSRP